MLMLERAAETVNPSECNDPAVLLACSLGSDSCPAACRDNTEETIVDENGEKVVVKSGDLSISATAAEGRKVIVNGATSDLDTITLRASEAITINSVTLERFGYSSAADIESVWLEDSLGNKITSERSLSSTKDTVTLNLKKDYKEFNSEDTITIVVKTNTFSATYATWSQGTNMWFKVTAVDSSAKNLDIANYDAYLYDMVVYNGNDVNVDLKGKSKSYNYSPDEAFEVAKVKVTATNAAIKVNGFTLKNEEITVASGGTKATVMDLDEFVDKVIVSVDGTEVRWLKYSLKRDELRVTFDDYEIAINKNAQFVVEVTLKDFDKYGEAISLKLADSSDLSVQEVKTSARANVKPTANAKAGYEYVFRGGEIRIDNTKLSSTIDAARGSSEVVIWEGMITVPEAIKVANTFKIVPSISGQKGTAPADQWVVSIKMYIAGDEYESNKDWTFKDVVIEKSGKVQFVVELEDLEAIDDGTITFTPSVVDYAALSPKYDDSGKSVEEKDFAGSIQLSKIKVQPSKWNLDNKVTKDVEFITLETSVKTPIFEGTYTAKKGDVDLKTFIISKTLTAAEWGALDNQDRITFYLSIDGKEVSSLKVTKADFVSSGSNYILSEDKDFSPISVKNEEKVSVKLEAQVYATKAWFSSNFNLALEWEDKDGAKAGTADRNTVKIKFVEKGSVTVADDVETIKNTVLLSDSDLVLAKFIIKPSKGNNSVKFEGLKMTVPVTAAADDFDVKIGTNNVDVDSFTSNTLTIEDENIEVPSEWLKVEVRYKNELAAGEYNISLTEVNGKTQSSQTFNKKVVNALISVWKQEVKTDVTKYTFDVDKSDDRYSIANLKFTYDDSTSKMVINGNISDGATAEEGNGANVKYVTQIDYDLIDSAATTKACPANDTANGITYADDGTTCTKTQVTEVTAHDDWAGTYDCTKANFPADASNANVTYAESGSVATTHACIRTETTAWVAKIDVSSPTTTPITITKVKYNDFFKVGDTYVKVGKTSNN